MRLKKELLPPRELPDVGGPDWPKTGITVTEIVIIVIAGLSCSGLFIASLIG